MEAGKAREEERAQLLLWDPSRQEPKPVVVVDTADTSADAEDNMINFRRPSAHLKMTGKCSCREAILLSNFHLKD